MVERAPLQLTCSVVDVVGSVTFHWQLEREELVEGERLRILSTVNSSTLLLQQAAVEDEGVYCCIAEDYLTSIKRNLTVRIMGELRSNTHLSLKQLTDFVRC